MVRRNTLVIVLAGGEGGRLELLTKHRAKPAVPFGGLYRLIDFPLSHCMHAGLADVWVIQQYNPHSLSEHLRNGRPWDLDRTIGGLLVVHPHLGGERGGFHQGTADALWRQAPLIREFDPDTLLVVSSDAVYRMDYAEVVEAHRDGGADVTMVTTKVNPEDAARYGVVESSENGRVTGYAYKPEQPATDRVTTEVFAFRPSEALELLDSLAADAEDGLEDLGHGLLPTLVAAGRAREFRFNDYWRDVGTVQSYWEAHLDLVQQDPPFRLDDPTWPIIGAERQRAPAMVSGSAQVSDSMLAPGCRVHGHIERSVIAPGVLVEEGASVVESVLLHNCVIHAGAQVVRAVVDSDASIGSDARIGADGGGGAGEVTLVESGSRVAAGRRVAAGARIQREPRAR